VGTNIVIPSNYRLSLKMSDIKQANPTQLDATCNISAEGTKLQVP